MHLYVQEKDLEVHKERRRVSSESSQASNSSSSSTFSSLDYKGTPQPEKFPPRQIITCETSSKITSTKEQKHSLAKGLHSPDIRDVVKDSMYSEARCVPIKSFVNDQRKVMVIKHIDSPRPLQRFKLGKPKATVHEGSTYCFAKVQEGTNNERLALPRFSCDGRKSRDAFKTNMKLKELPRFSLDSKASSIKCSALESRLSFLGHDPLVENENSSQVPPVNQESGSHSRSNSIVAKLMGLDAFPDSFIRDECLITKTKSSPRIAFLSESSTEDEGSKQKQVSSSTPVSQKHPFSPSTQLHSASLVRKITTCSRLPMEPAPWKQQDYNEGSQVLAKQSGKAPTNNQCPSSSVYGEIEKRITELEFKRSGKDLRELKQILKAMQETRERLEYRRGESAKLKMQERSSLGDSCSNQNTNFSMWQNRKTYQQQVATNKGTAPSKQLGSFAGMMKPAKVIEKVKISSSSQVPIIETLHKQNIVTPDPKYHRNNPAYNEKTKYPAPMNKNMKEPGQRLPSFGKKITRINLELDRTLQSPKHIRAQNYTTSERGSGMVSPRVQHALLKTKKEYHASCPTSESGKAKKQSSKKVRESCFQNRKHRVKSTELDTQLSNVSSVTRNSSCHGDTASTKSESHNSIVSNIETHVISLANSMSINSREKQDYVISKEHMPAVELAIPLMEQPSPVSVLDAPFNSEDSPSPVKKITTAFGGDEILSPDEAERHFQSLNDVTYCIKFDSSYKHNQKSENRLHLVHQLRLLKTEPNESAAKNNKSAYLSINPGRIYINKTLLASGLLNDTSIIRTADQLVSLCHLINSHMFHALEDMDNPMEEAIGKLTEKNNQIKLNQKTQIKVISDMINEILVRKMTPDALFTLGRKRMSLQGLVKEVCSQVDHLCTMPHCNLDQHDGSIRLLTADMKYQSDDWTDYNVEVPALVLDIEQQIFKDLINEVIPCEVVGLLDWSKRHCRQLFTK